MSAVVSDLAMLLDGADLPTFLSWSELNLSKRPNMIENTLLYGFIKKDMRPLFKNNYDPKLVSLTLLAFQGAYESMLRKTCLVLLVAAKLKFRDREWYGPTFKSKEKNVEGCIDNLVKVEGNVMRTLPGTHFSSGGGRKPPKEFLDNLQSAPARYERWGPDRTSSLTN